MNKKLIGRIVRHINLGTIILLLIILYIFAYIITYLGKDTIAVYEVESSDLADRIEGTGIILRDEILYETEQSGYVNFLIRDGARTKKNGSVYMLDTTGKVQSFIDEMLSKEQEISKEEIEKVSSGLHTFMESYSDDHFYDTYESHKDIDHNLTAYTDTLIAKNRDELVKKYGKNSYIAVNSPREGIVSFSSDGLEKLRMKEINDDLFAGKTRMKELRTNKKYKKGTPVYRLIRGQNWKVVIPVSEGEYSHLKELSKSGQTRLDVLFHKDNFETRCAFTCKKPGGTPCVVLEFDNYIQRYVDQRYLYVELIISRTEGLKIPSTALVNKKAYKIPENLLTEGGNTQGRRVVNIREKDKKGVYRINPVQVEVIREAGSDEECEKYVDQVIKVIGEKGHFA